MKARFSFGEPGWENPRGNSRITRVYYDSTLPHARTADGIAASLITIAKTQLKVDKIVFISGAILP